MRSTRVQSDDSIELGRDRWTEGEGTRDVGSVYLLRLVVKMAIFRWHLICHSILKVTSEEQNYQEARIECRL